MTHSVAVFDVFQSPDRPNPVVLSQPQLRLQDLLPGFESPDTKTGPQPNDSRTRRAYIGVIEENKSLYALSPEHYPFVYFADRDKTTPIVDSLSGAEK